MYDQLGKLLGKAVFAAGAAALAWCADKYVKNKTGKHIHQHAADFVAKLWRRLKNWARKYLDDHPSVQKVYISSRSQLSSATVRRLRSMSAS